MLKGYCEGSSLTEHLFSEQDVILFSLAFSRASLKHLFDPYGFLSSAVSCAGAPLGSGSGALRGFYDEACSRDTLPS